jgi:chromosome segregation ATPase
VAKKKNIEPETVAPDPTRAEQLAHEALVRLKEVQEQLHRDANDVQAEREQYTYDSAQLGQDQAQLQAQRESVEQQRTELAAMADELEQRRAELQASVASYEHEKGLLAAKQRDLASQQDNVAQERQAQDSAAAVLAERERRLEQAEQQLRTQTAEFELKLIEIGEQEKELQARAKHLDEFAAELTETREALSCLQTQLSHGQQDIAAQREELLQQLGNTHQVPLRVVSSPPEQDAPLTSSSKDGVFPKPAASRAAEQFRKLRRDAKRKAIGA